MDGECRTTSFLSPNGLNLLKVLIELHLRVCGLSSAIFHIYFDISPAIFLSRCAVLVAGSVFCWFNVFSNFQSGVWSYWLFASDLCEIAPARCMSFSCHGSCLTWNFWLPDLDYGVVSHSMSWTTCSQTPSFPEVLTVLLSASLICSFSDFSSSGLGICYQTAFTTVRMALTH